MTKTTILQNDIYLCGSCGREFEGREARETHFDETGHGLRRFAERTPIVASKIDARELSEIAALHGETERVGGPSTPSEREPYEADPRKAEAVEFAKAYEGEFEFMLSMREACSKVVVRLSPKMIDAILRCKTRAEQSAAYRTDVAEGVKADPSVRRNKFAGSCGNCRNEVAEGAGRIEKVDGRWIVFHLDGGCPSKAPESDGERRNGAGTPSPTPDVPAGRYAFVADEGHVAFAKVDRPTEGRWEGRTFVNLLVGSTGDWNEMPMKGESGKAILRKIVAAGIEESARLFGRKAEKCGYCMANLSLVQSRAAGYGATCAAKHGHHYPSKAEARRILDEEGLSLAGITDL